MQGGVRRRAQAPLEAIQTGQTYHVAGTYDGTTSRLYVNGRRSPRCRSGAIGTTSSRPQHRFLDRGATSSSRARWTTSPCTPPLSAARVKAHSDLGGAAPPPPPTVAAPVA